MKLTINLKKAATDRAKSLVVRLIDGERLSAEDTDYLVSIGVLRRRLRIDKPYKSTPKVPVNYGK
jgi:hypothetical protein